MALLIIRILAELLEEPLQRMIVGKVVEAAAVEIEGEAVIVVIGDGIDAIFDADGNDGRRNGVDDIGEARNRRGLNLDSFGIRPGDFERNAGCEHSGCDTGDGEALSTVRETDVR